MTNKNTKRHENSAERGAFVFSRFALLASLFSLPYPLSPIPYPLLSASSPGPAQPTFEIRSVGEAVPAGPLVALEADWTVKLGGDKPGKVVGAELVSLRRVGVPLPPPPNQPLALLVNGDRLAGKAVALDEDRLLFRADDLTPGGQQVSVPPAYLAAVWLKTPRGEPLPTNRDEDELLLDNGDILRGTLAGLDVKKNTLMFRPSGRDADLRLEPGRVRRVALNTRLARELKPDGPAFRAVLRNGSRITFASARLEGANLIGTTLFDAELTVPLDELVALDALAGPADYLSDLKPADFETKPFNGLIAGVGWPVSWGADVAADRRRLRLGGGSFDKGVGMRGESRLTFDLGGKYRRFEALVGTDDRAGPAGRARVRVLVDGKPVETALPKGRDLTGRDGPVRVSVPVVGAERLTLEVGFGEDGSGPTDERNLVTWADARLIRAK